MTTPLPPPPPPPPPPPNDTKSDLPPVAVESKEVDHSELSSKIHKAASILETNRCLETEHEAVLHFASTLLANPAGLPNENKNLSNGKGSSNRNSNKGKIPAGVKDAWLALMENSTMDANATSTSTSTSTNMPSAPGDAEEKYEYPLPRGQLANATKTMALSTSLIRASEVAQRLHKKRKADSQSCVDALQSMIMVNSSSSGDTNNDGTSMMSMSMSTPEWFMKAFDDKVQEIREYHARHPTDLNGDDISKPGDDYSVYQMTLGGFGGGDVNGNGNGNSNVNNNNNGNAPVSKPNHLQMHSKKRKMGHPVADGYDLHSVLYQQLYKIKSGQIFSVEEVMGKYLDLHPSHEAFYTLMMSLKKNEKSSQNTSAGTEGEKVTKISYPDFITLLATGLNTVATSSDSSGIGKGKFTLSEKEKLSQRKKYIRFLHQLNEYLVHFLNRVSPLLNVQMDVVQPAIDSFHSEWSEKGGVAGWECKVADKILAKNMNIHNGNGTTNSSAGEGDRAADTDADADSFDLKQYSTVEELFEKVSPDQLKIELAKLGMKCGGKPMDRAKRLWCARDTPVDQLPAKLFTKGKGPNANGNGKGNGHGHGNKNGSTSTSTDVLNQNQGGNQRRIDIARMEIIANALLNQLRPTIDVTARRAERRLTQTFNEKEREMEEEINGAYDKASKSGGTGDGDETDSDDEDAPIYNPKGVPLGWDGKPIPYWLFKLHGLNHFYQCEICGNESYRGRHNFEKHFAEAKHSYGMKCLGIPNTKHFHGVTKIEDAQNLWKKLQKNVNKDMFDASQDEEYEDSHGNVLSRATYEDLARQGLL